MQSLRNILWFGVCFFIACLFGLVIITGGNWALYAFIICGCLLVFNRRRYSDEARVTRLSEALSMFLRMRR